MASAYGRAPHERGASRKTHNLRLVCTRRHNSRVSHGLPSLTEIHLSAIEAKLIIPAPRFSQHAVHHLPTLFGPNQVFPFRKLAPRFRWWRANLPRQDQGHGKEQRTCLRSPRIPVPRREHRLSCLEQGTRRITMTLRLRVGPSKEAMED